MGMPNDTNARLYYRVAYQRLEDGVLILERLNRPNAAIYMSGYAVECILKALLLTSTPSGQRARMSRSLKVEFGHDLLRLRGELGQQGVSIPMPVRDELVYVGSWSTQLRYDPSLGNKKDARRFIEATQIILQWAGQRMMSWRN